MAKNKAEAEIKSTLNETSIIVEDALRSIADQVGDIFKNAIDKTSTFSKTLANDIKGNLNSLARSTDVLEKNQAKLNKGELTRADITKQIEARRLKIQSIEKQIEISSRNNLGNTAALNKQFQQSLIYNAELEKELELQAKMSDKIEKSMGSLGATVEGLSKGLKSAGLGALDTHLGLSKALAATKAMVAENEGNVSNLEASKHLTKEVGKNLAEALDPASLIALGIKELYHALKEVDKESGVLAKSFNTSYKEALHIRDELTSVAGLSGDAAVNTNRLQESLIAVGKSLGSNAMLNEEDLITFTKLREQAGYTNDELIGIQKISLVNGKTLEDNTSEILGAAEAYASRNKLVVNEKDILREVSKTSASIKLSLKGGASALAEAVVKAKQYGLTLEQADKISSGLLNFEQSISSELEAELLTGRSLNFERARSLALNNDVAGAAEEIARQVGSSAEFAKMNRIQQEAIAKAAGMERNELAQSLIDREALAALSGVEGKNAQDKFNNLVKQVGLEKAKKQLGNDQLALQFQQQSVAERFNQTVEKLKELFVSLAEPILAIVSPLMDLLSLVLIPIAKTLQGIKEIMHALFDPAKNLSDVFAEMGPLVSGIATALTIAGAAVTLSLVPGLLKAAGNALLALGPMIGNALAAISWGSAMTIGVGALAIAGGIAAGVMAMNSAKSAVKIHDGQINPDGGLMVSGKKGTYSLDRNDTVIAGTNLGTATAANNNMVDNTKTHNLLERLIKATEAGGNVIMDGSKFAHIGAMNTFSI
jgi:hypothetical protein